MANFSDKGGARLPTDPAPVFVGEGGATDHPLLADVRSLSRDQINGELRDHYGSMEAAASAIAAAGLRQLANVKVAFGIDDGRPALGRERDVERGTPMYERLAEIDRAPELTVEDKRLLKSEALRRYGQRRHAHTELNAIGQLRAWVLELCNDNYPRAKMLMDRIGKEQIDALLKINKRERRGALARVLEEMTFDETA